MKKLIIIILIIAYPIKNFGQVKYDYNQGYIFIKKAEKTLNQGKIIEAEEFLGKAKLSNFGFCGNAWASAFGQINLIQTQVYIKRKEYDKALNPPDSIGGCGIGADCTARDSLKIETLMLKFGKQKVKEAFEKVNEINVNEIDFIKSYSINLPDLNYIFEFVINEYYFDFNDGKSVVKNKTNIELLNEVKNFSYFKIIE
jgi:hypothetical protein